MTGASSAAVQALLRIRYHPAFAGDTVIGGPGFSLPEMNEALIFPVVAETLQALGEHGIMVDGPAGIGSIIVIDAAMPMLDLRIGFNGHADCAVILGQGEGFSGKFQFSGPHGLIVSAGFGHMGAPSRLGVMLKASCAAYFGKNVTSIESQWLVEGDDATPRAVMVGDDAMIDWGVWCQNHESHGIFDIETLATIDEPGQVILGPHCWIGQGVRIARGVRIGAGSIIGLGSVVASDIPARVSAGGVPARVLREGVTWHRDRKPSEAAMKAIIAAL